MGNATVTISTESPPLAEAQITVNGQTLPDEWEPITIGALTERNALCVKNGFPQGKHNTLGSGVPHLRPFNVSEDGNIDLSQIKYVPAPGKDSPYWVRREDVVFNNTNSEELVGKTAFFGLEGEFVLSNHMTIIRVLDASLVDPFWLSMGFLHLWRQRVFKAMCRRHVNQASVSVQRIKSLELRLPPLAEQRTIAQVLRTVQRAKRATEKVIAATRQLKQSLMRHLFTYGPVPIHEADRAELKETKVGEIPCHWKIEPLKNVARLVSGGTPSKNRLEFWNESVPWATPKDMKLPRLWDTQDHISEAGLEEGSRLVESGSLFIVIRGMILAKDLPVAMAMVPMAFNQDMKGILAKPDVDAEYLLYAIVHHKAGLACPRFMVQAL